MISVSLRRLSATMTNRGLNTLGGAFPNALGNPGMNKAFELNLVETAPLCALGGLFFYKMGDARAKGKEMNIRKIIPAIGEGAVMSFLADTTKNVIPVIAGAWMAFQAGVAQGGRWERFQAALHGLVLFTVGYLSLNVGADFAHFFHRKDAATFLDHTALVSEKDVTTLKGVTKKLKTVSPGLSLPKPLTTALNRLIFNSDIICKETALGLKNLRQSVRLFNRAQDQFAEALQKMPAADLAALPADVKNELESMGKYINEKSMYRWVRTSSRWAIYLLGIFLVGEPIYYTLSKVLFPSKKPDTSLQSQAFGAPLWLQHLVPPRQQQVPFAGFGVPYGNGPVLSQSA